MALVEINNLQAAVGGEIKSPEIFHDYLRSQTIARPLA